jgi:hypothetical protein
MARKVQMDTSYIFTPSANRITIDKGIPQEKLLLITNLASNTVIYNFSDPNLKVSSYTRTRDSQIAVTGTPGTSTVTNLWPSVTPIVGQRINGYGIAANTIITGVTGTSLTLSNAITSDPYLNNNLPVSIFGTIIVLNYNTSSMNATDKLQIFVDEYEEAVRPAEVYTDPVSKQRVSTPQSLIDTDFEYGLQPTKWETCQLVGHRASFNYNPTTPITIGNITTTNASRTVDVETRVAISGSGTITQAGTSGVAPAITGNGATKYLSEAKPGTVLFDSTNAIIGAVSSVSSDNNLLLKTNAISTTNGTMNATGQRYFDNGAPGSGIFSPSGGITTSTGSTTVTGVSTRFLSELRVGDALYATSGVGAPFVGTILSIQSDTSLTLVANATVTLGSTGGAGSTGSGTVWTSTAAPTGATTIRVGSFLQGSAVPAGTYVVSQGTGTGQNAGGTYNVNTTVTSITGVINTFDPFIVSQYTPSTNTSANPIFVQLTSNSDANGAFLISGPTGVASTLGGTTAGTAAPILRYDMEVSATSTGSIFDNPSTYAYPGTFFFGAQIGGSTQASFATDNGAGNSIITVTTGTGHNLLVGNPIFVTGASNTACNGNWYVARVISPTSFEYIIQTQSGTITTAAQGRVYVRQLGNVLHRPTDGGVKITAGTNSPNAQLIRQSRRYFRYQSGKGVQYSTGTVFKPSVLADSLVSDGTRVTVTCRDSHNLYPGAIIIVSGATSTNGTFNGTYAVDAVGISNNKFTYIPSSVPTSQTAGGFPINVSVNTWVSAINRLGMFDFQNGMYFKFDGTTLFACRRSSTDQLPGTITMTNGSSSIAGTGTRFSTLLKPGNMVVIRGMSYMVTQITSDTAMNISPEYRGTTIASPSSAKITKTIDLEIPQSDWNIDRCDGTGPSGFNLDLTRMQMWYIDFSWYGAGAIRYGFKDQRGEVIYCNRIAHANTKTEAYMRSGNLPARYETNTIPYTTTLAATLSSATGAAGNISVTDASQFPSSGFVYINPPSTNNSGLGELIEYSAKNTAVSPHTLTIVSRALAGGTPGGPCTTTIGSNVITSAGSFATFVQKFMHVHGPGIPVGTYVVGVSGTTVYLSNPATATGSVTLVFRAFAATAAQTYTYSATAPVGITFYNPQFAPNISHWGSAAIMDGRYDDDKSLIFTGGMPAAVTIPAASVLNVAGQPLALISVRISPSVDTGIGDILGRKELVNRMQLALNSAGISSDRRLLVDLRLNGQVSGGTWQSLGGSSLAQVCYHTANTSISGGESIFSFYTSAAGGGAFSVTSYDLVKARDLGNCILGGGSSTSVNTNIYPDGPDVLTMVVRNLEATAGNAVARISWTEAQA